MSALQPPPAPSGTLLCPRCGGVLPDEQSWCLECGLAARTRVHPPPNWRAPIALTCVLLALLAAGIAVALVTLLDTPETTPAATTVTAPAAAPPAAPAATVPATPTAPTTTTTVPGATTPTATTPGAQGSRRTFEIPGTGIRLPANATR